MSGHFRWEPKRNTRRNIAASIADSLAIEGLNADVKEVDGTYTITLDSNSAFFLSEVLTSLRDAQTSRVRDVGP